MLWIVIEVIVSLILAVAGALLGDGYKDPMYTYWLCVIMLYSIIMGVLLKKVDSQENEIKILKDKLSALMITKRTNGEQTFDIAIYPKCSDSLFQTNRSIPMEIIINAPYPCNKAPDIKLVSNKQMIVKVNRNTVSFNKFADNYEYFLPSDGYSAIYRSNTFFKYELELTFNTPGEYTIKPFVGTDGLNSMVQQTFNIR
ncbi:hypothetical protein [Parageobacillus toebii]|uniref:Uncharacterized protein n=1 Tax=Parageobacillus toebii TaxID=153151 RepID=A0A150MJV0_9BACL|nr:hypothetical protein [Parageobacillus toebii]KYD24575.1 hypothetical protein B4110_0583 [Parageobacillus toebii]